MKIEEIEEQIAVLDLPGKQKKALLSLIDLKVDNEMDKSLTRFEAAVNALEKNMNFNVSALEKNMNSNLRALEKNMNSNVRALEKNMNSKFKDMDSNFKSIDSKFTGQFNLLKWIIGGLTVVLTAAITILKYIG